MKNGVEGCIWYVFYHRNSDNFLSGKKALKRYPLKGASTNI